MSGDTPMSPECVIVYLNVVYIIMLESRAFNRLNRLIQLD